MTEMFTRLGFALLWLFHWLPLGLQAAVGNGLGWLACLLTRRRKHIARRNLELCFPQWSAAQRRSDPDPARTTQLPFRHLEHRSQVHGVADEFRRGEAELVEPGLKPVIRQNTGQLGQDFRQWDQTVKGRSPGRKRTGRPAARAMTTIAVA